MATHSALGASSMYRWATCPGSYALSRAAPHRPSSIYAARGTLAHRFIELGEPGGFASLELGEIGREYEVDGHTVTVDEDLFLATNFMLEYLQTAAGFADWMKVELPVKLDHLFPRKPPTSVFGTLDAVTYEGRQRTLEVADFKAGAGIPVSPEWNPQLLFYAAGASILAPERPWRYVLTVVQPLAGGAPIRSWEISPADLEMWIKETLIPAVMLCGAKDAPLVTGDHCRFCPVVPFCPALQGAASHMAKQEFEFAEVIPETCSENLPALLDIADEAELFINRLREYAVGILQGGGAVPGWGLVPTRPTRKWLLDEKALDEKLHRLGIAHAELWEERIRSPAQLEKTLRRLRHGRKLWDAAQQYVEARSSGVKLGRLGAPAREEFDEIGE